MKKELKRKKINKLKIGKNLEFGLEAEKLLYWVCFLSIPILIGVFTGIVNITNDHTTKVFFIITSVVYLIGLILIHPILNINEEFKIIAKEYANTLNTDNLSASEKYEEIQDIVTFYKLKFSEHAFQNLYKSLRIKKIIENGEKKNLYYLTCDVECFFNEDTIINKNIYIKLINQITQTLTAIGIFGTFLGIIQGVSGINLNNNNYIRQSVAELLTGIKLAFNSSLYGIMFSILLVLALKLVVDMTMKNVYKVSNYLEDILLFYSEQQAIDDLKLEVKKELLLLKGIMDLMKINGMKDNTL